MVGGSGLSPIPNWQKPGIQKPGKKMKTKSWFLQLCTIGLVLILSCSNAIPALANPPQAALFSAYDVINAVNQIRESNGLPPYQIDGSLMASAQAHSEYQASIGQVTHTGQGGSNAKSRAMAAGYGGGAAVFVSENIYGGSSASAQSAVNWWMGDALHQNTMLSPNYTDAGAGVASNGGAMYFTLDVGYVSGSPGSGGTGSSSSTTVPGTALAFIPVQISTPDQDGSIVHVVQSGQTLWTIAAAYKVSLPEILQLNNMTDTTTIYPGNKILVKAALANPTPTSTEKEIETDSTARPTMTRRPGRLRTPVPGETEALETLTPVPAAGSAISASPTSNSGSVDPLLIIIIALVGVGVLLTAAGILIQRRS
jgi:LysM repeat protein